MKITTCNNCEGVYEDTNPGEDSIEYPENTHIDGKLCWTALGDYEDENTQIGWACPRCLTDGYLVDNIPEWKQSKQ